MIAEARNQIFAFNALKQMLQQGYTRIRIPEVYRVIEKDDIIYLVMEYIHGETLKDLLTKDIADDSLRGKYEQIAKAIKLLLSIKVPENAVPGPVRCGIIKHPIFKDTVASIEYASVDELQRHLTFVSFSKTNPRIRLTTLLGCRGTNGEYC
jgi:serine/threonine protein kinase